MLDKEYSQTQPRKRRIMRAAINPYILIPASFAILVAIGATPRLARQVELNQVHHELTIQVPEVKATIVKQAEGTSKLMLPGDIQPVQNIPIFARANGYLLKRFVDIGDNVKAGELLAIIDTPELDQQVQQAKANLRLSQANLASAKSDRETFSSQLFAAGATIKQMQTNLQYSETEIKRYQELATEGAVSWEQRDQTLKEFNSDTAALQVAQHNETAAISQVASADAKIAAANQSIQANEANLNQLKAMQAFQKVVAPCDGVITDRFVDAGSLVAAGGSSGTTQLLNMARTDVLRIYVDVPQSDYRYIHNGDRADLLLQEFPGTAFAGTVTNIAGSLNSASRTLQTEIRIQNQNHILKPGSYAEVRFVYNRPNPPLVIPSNAAVTKNDGLYSAVVTNGTVSYQKIDVARDYGNKLEIGSGLKANDVVLLDPPDSLANGSAVKPLIPTHVASAN